MLELRRSNIHLFAITLLILTVVSSTAFAQSDGVVIQGSAPSSGSDDASEDALPTVKLNQPDNYKGVTPGVTDVVSHTRVKKIHSSASHELTWIGYQKEETRERIFFQFLNMPLYEVEPGGDKITFTFEDTAPTQRNFMRVIDTSAFGGKVDKISTKRKGKSTIVTVSLNTAAQGSTSVEGDYLFYDLAK